MGLGLGEGEVGINQLADPPTDQTNKQANTSWTFGLLGIILHDKLWCFILRQIYF